MSHALTIQRLEPQGGRNPGVTIHTANGATLAVPLQVWLDSGLGIGDTLTPARRTALETATRRWQAREMALNQLSHRPRSRSELARHLIRKEVRRDDIDPVLDHLEQLGLLDDRLFAEALARDRIRHKPRGGRRMIQELRQKGVDHDTAEAAIQNAMEEEGTEESALAARAGERWARTQGLDLLRVLVSEAFSPEREKARKKLYAYLGRRGFMGPSRAAGADAAVAEARIRLDEAGT
jgi:regulatory protein